MLKCKETKCVSLSSSKKRKSNQISSSIDLLSNLLENRLKLEDIINDLLHGKNSNYDHFRPTLWKIFFELVSIENPTSWETILFNKRLTFQNNITKYKSKEIISALFANNLEKVSELVNNFPEPKMLIESLELIKKDVERTFQEIDLFRNQAVLEDLAEMLYIWIIEQECTCYSQGMNEILGTLYYAMFALDVPDPNNFEEDNKYVKLFYLLNSEEHFKADLYYIYSEFMRKSFKNLYNYQEMKKNKKVNEIGISNKNKLTLDEINNSDDSELKKRTNKIFYFYLRIVDSELFHHIYKQIDPYIFLFRWILCILNREIVIKDILKVWDCIIGIEYLDYNKTNYTDVKEFLTFTSKFKTNFNFLDFMCVSMIRSLRKVILSNEDDECVILSYLMHFPSDISIKDLIKDAVKIREKIYKYFDLKTEFVYVD